MKPASIHTRRWNDPPHPYEGQRILITRYRPRGLPKADETWDLWMTELAPSKELLAAFKGKTGKPPIPWSAYRAAYLMEMRHHREAVDELARKVADGEPIALLCSSSCTDERRCHRSLLRELIEKRVASVS
jgi:uncharacterized protein YeaO (DUF488 family)